MENCLWLQSRAQGLIGLVKNRLHIINMLDSTTNITKQKSLIKRVYKKHDLQTEVFWLTEDGMKDSFKFLFSVDTRHRLPEGRSSNVTKSLRRVLFLFWVD